MTWEKIREREEAEWHEKMEEQQKELEFRQSEVDRLKREHDQLVAEHECLQAGQEQLARLQAEQDEQHATGLHDRNAGIVSTNGLIKNAWRHRLRVLLKPRRL